MKVWWGSSGDKDQRGGGDQRGDGKGLVGSRVGRGYGVDGV